MQTRAKAHNNPYGKSVEKRKDIGVEAVVKGIYVKYELLLASQYTQRNARIEWPEGKEYTSPGST